MLDATGEPMWQDEAGFDSWNLYQGDLSLLKSGGLYTQDPLTVDVASRLCGLDATTAEMDEPLFGEALFYLVTGIQTGSAIESTLGTDSDDVERPHANPCP
jgi:hypothetical protein